MVGETIDGGDVMSFDTDAILPDDEKPFQPNPRIEAARKAIDERRDAELDALAARMVADVNAMTLDELAAALVDASHEVPRCHIPPLTRAANELRSLERLLRRAEEMREQDRKSWWNRLGLFLGIIGPDAP